MNDSVNSKLRKLLTNAQLQVGDILNLKEHIGGGQFRMSVYRNKNLVCDEFPNIDDEDADDMLDLETEIFAKSPYFEPIKEDYIFAQFHNAPISYRCIGLPKDT